MPSERHAHTGTNDTAGLPVDRSGAPAVDPTKNVLDLVEAANRRQDDLRGAFDRRVDLALAHAESVAQIREQYRDKLAQAESSRIDSIRQVDREEGTKAAAGTATAVTTLAKQTTDLQQTLAKQVTDTAAAQEARNSAQYSDINKRLSALESLSSEGKGKQQVVDPQVTEMIAEMRGLRQSRAQDVGKREGMSESAKLLIAGVSLIATLLVIGAVLVTLVLFLNRNTDPPIYTPAPQGTQLPSSPPASVPR